MNSAERFLSIADIVDMMFYYREVHIVISQIELKQLLDAFGEDVLYQLVVTKRLLLYPCNQYVGVAQQRGLESLGLISVNINSIDSLLYRLHQGTIKDYYENRRFAEKFAKVLDVFRYPKELDGSLRKDLENKNLLTSVTKEYIRQYYPSYTDLDSISVEATYSESSFLPLYKIEGNLRLDELNVEHQRLGYGNKFDYSSVLLALGQTLADCFLASNFRAELISNQRWSEIYKLRMNECISQSERSSINIDHFQEMVSNDFLSPGESFVRGRITPEQLLCELNKTESIKFREWLQTLPENSSLSGELFKQIQNQNSNRFWVKFSRSLAQIIVSTINPLLGAGVTFLDSFVGNQLFNGWTPGLFVSKVLNSEAYRK